MDFESVISELHDDLSEKNHPELFERNELDKMHPMSLVLLIEIQKYNLL